MRLVQFCLAGSSAVPASLDDYEAFAQRSLMRDIYGFYASGSVLGNQQTVKENEAAYSR